MNGYRISCIVPVFNGARFLAEALDSVLAQSDPPFEIIVIDDGSTDSTADVVGRYAPRIRYRRQVNAGPAAARNAGIELAAGELITFLDADDVWHADKLALQCARLRARPELQIVLAHVQNFWMPELCEEEERIGDHPLKTPLAGYLFQAMLARRSVFATVGLLNPEFRMSEDTEWFRRAVECSTVLEVLPETLVYRRFHLANTSRDQKAVRAALLDVVHDLLLRGRNAGQDS